MPFDPEPLPEYRLARLEAAQEIERLLHENPAYLGLFRERIRAFGEQGRAWEQECEEIDQRHNEDEGVARRDPRLRDKRAGPPSAGYEWYDYDFTGLYRDPPTKEEIEASREKGFPGTWEEFPEAWRERRWGYWRRESPRRVSHPCESLGLEKDGRDLRFRPLGSDEKTLTRYYIILAAIHDCDLEGCTCITDEVWPSFFSNDVWPPFPLNDVWHRMRGWLGDRTAFVRTAMKCVKADLQRTGEKPTGQGQPGKVPAGGPTHVQAMDKAATAGRKPMVGDTLNLGVTTIYWRHVIQWLQRLRGWRKVVAIIAVGVIFILALAFFTRSMWLPLVHPHVGTRNIEQQRGNLGSTSDQ